MWYGLLYFQKNISGTLYEFSFLQDSILCPYSNGTEKAFGALRPCLSPYRDEDQMNLSYMVLQDMWNMFGQKFLSFNGG